MREKIINTLLILMIAIFGICLYRYHNPKEVQSIEVKAEPKKYMAYAKITNGVATCYSDTWSKFSEYFIYEVDGQEFNVDIEDGWYWIVLSDNGTPTFEDDTYIGSTLDRTASIMDALETSISGLDGYKVERTDSQNIKISEEEK